jgi:hypothetical protein
VFAFCKHKETTMTNQHNSSTPPGTGRSSAANEPMNASTSARHHVSVTDALKRVGSLLQPPLFPLGAVVATPGAIDLLDRTGTNASHLLTRHQLGDWGVVCDDDAIENSRALHDGNRLLSAYDLGEQKERLWIITEHDRSVTTLLLPEEY